MIMLKVTEMQDFTLSLEDKFLGKREGGVSLMAPLSPALLGLRYLFQLSWLTVSLSHNCFPAFSWSFCK